MSLLYYPLLTPANVKSLITTPSVQRAFYQLKLHKFLIECDDRGYVEKIFEALFLLVASADFCPTNVIVTSSQITFFIEKCKSAVEKLCKQGFVIRVDSKVFSIKVQLCDSHTDKSTLLQLQEIIEKRIKNTELNLEGIANDLARKQIYFSASNLVFLGGYLQQCLNNNFTSKISIIKLGNNGIKSLKGSNRFQIFANLTSLNLRNNLLQDINELEHLQVFNLKEIWLDNNPLCQKFSNEKEYIESVNRYCMYLQKLDGILLKTGFAQPRRNFVCNTNALKLVDHFLEHYFTVFDLCRMNLFKLYDRHSLFSLSCAFLKTALAQSLSANKFISVSRNIFKLSDVTKGDDQLHIGADDICRFLYSLPSTQHDPDTFTTDIVQHNNSCTIIMISGIFRVFSEKIVPSDIDHSVYYNFCRTFCIRHFGENEFRIINEVLYLTNLKVECPKNFTKSIPLRLSEYNAILGGPNQEEKHDMCKIMSSITEKSESECERYLKNSSWDIKHAINLFIKDFTNKSS